MWEESDFTGGQDEVRLIESHRFDADRPGVSCQVILRGLNPANVCGRPESEHRHSAWSAAEAKRASGAELIRQADAAQYARPAIPPEDVGRIRVRLLNATPDPLGSVAALI